MKTIGVITTAIAASAVAFVAVLAVRALPDIQRYLKIRSM